MLVGNDNELSIGIIGFGAFGRLMARHLGAWFPLVTHDPAACARIFADQMGVRFADVATAAACPVVVLATPVEKLDEAIAAIGPHLKPGTLVLDVTSVKLGPARLMYTRLPANVDIVCTHPLFGPQSARDGIAGQKIAVCPIRGGRGARVAAFLKAALGLEVHVTTPEEHDREVAVVQGLTHLVGRLLAEMQPMPIRLTTPSFEMLMNATEMVRHDSASVFLAIQKANPYAVEVRERFFSLAEKLRDSLNEPRLAKPAQR